MKFFMPSQANRVEAEKAYEITKAAAMASIKEYLEITDLEITDRRVAAVSYKRAGVTLTVEVGNRKNYWNEEVYAIYEARGSEVFNNGKMYLVCLPAQGVHSGFPIIIRPAEVTKVVDFEPSV